MNKLTILDKAEVESTEELDKLKARIIDYDCGFRTAYQSQMGYAFLAGIALLRAKEIVPHGKFLAWREAELPQITRSSASRYMQFAEALPAKDPTVGSLPEVKLLGNGAELSDDSKKKILETVYEVADGKTLTEMYRDLGVIRQPKAKEHHPVKQTPEEKLEAEKQADIAWGEALVADARELVEQWTDHTRDDSGRLPAVLNWPAKLRTELRGLHISLGKVLDGIGRKQKPHAKGAKKGGGK